jgi:hypothetical protein
MFLFPNNLQHVPAILHGLMKSGAAWFGSTGNGWMTRSMFLEWVRLLIAWLDYKYPLSATRPVRPQIILLLDNHTSRECVEAMLLLDERFVHVVTFPPHVTHILQPFDVVLAKSFKAECRKVFTLFKAQYEAEDPVSRPVTEVNRCLMVQAALTGWQKALNLWSGQNAFRATGILPVSEKPLLSRYVIDSPVDMEEVKKREAPKKLWISSSILTSQTMILKLIEANRYAALKPTHRMFCNESLGYLAPPTGEHQVLPSEVIACYRCRGEMKPEPWPEAVWERVHVRATLMHCPICGCARLHKP